MPLSTLSNGLDFDGSNDYVTFGAASGLGTATFTIETWFRRDGAGAPTTTSNPTGGGLQDAIPLVTKGRGEADGDQRDMNWFLGIDASSGVLVADFEEDGQPAPGQNHMVEGQTAIAADGSWHHAAVTYDGQTWTLYLDGTVDRTLTLASAVAPQSASTQHAALGSALTSGGAAQGFFNGALDEARVWNVARTPAQIRGEGH